MTGTVNCGNNITDGAVIYRVDRHGARIAVLPATCRHGHLVAVAGYRAREADGVLQLRCNACASSGASNPYWTLRSTPPVANVAELDDTPYQGDLPWQPTR